MNRLEKLPLDISILCLLPYIQPEDFDTFCFSCARFEGWSRDPKNIRYYLALHNFLMSQYRGLIWAIDNHSRVLLEYFLSLNKNNASIIAKAAEFGNIELMKLLSAYDNCVMIRAAEVGILNLL